MVCLVTDRRRADVLAQARAAVAAGIDLIQIRERDLDARALAALAAAVAGIASGSRTRVVVNDRLDVALTANAHGVHLRGDSFAVADARRIAPPAFLIGRSIHSRSDAVAAQGADYVIAGTVFPTASKSESVSWLGVEGLQALVAASSAPVLAIGGITIDRLADVKAAGAAGFAAIGLFHDVPMAEIVAASRALFDSPQAHP
jgi:thiamine-phosphate pyrophosphorylase